MALVTPENLHKHPSIRMPLADQGADSLGGVHTVTFHRGTIDVERMKASVVAVLEASPIFGGRINKQTLEWLLLCPGLCVGASAPECCSVWKVDFSKGQCGAIVSVRTLDAGLEQRLALGTGDADPLAISAADLTPLIDLVGKGDQVANKGAMLGANLRVCISQGKSAACVGFATSHVLGDGRTHHALLGRLNDAYSSEIQPPKLPPMPHLDNAQALPCLPIKRAWRSSLNPLEFFKRNLVMGICCGKLACQQGEALRLFTLRVSKAAAQSAKALAAARNPTLPPVHSTNDALIELLSPSTTSSTYNFTTVTETRGRVRGVPAFHEVPTSGNGVLLLSFAVPGGNMSHRKPRELYESWQTTPRAINCCALLRHREFGWNSWTSISRDHTLTLAGLERCSTTRRRSLTCPVG